MAISWELPITVLDYDQKHVSVSGIRTDSEKPEDIKTYTVGPIHINTSEQQIAVLDAIWNMYLADVELEAKIVAFAPIISALEAAGKANLEAREI